MSLLTDPAATGGYQFASQGFDDYMADFNTPKQEQPGSGDDFSGLDDLNPPPAPGEGEGEDGGTLPGHLQTPVSVARASASMLTIALDSTLSAILGVVADDDPARFKADPDQREELRAAFTEYVRLKGGDIPPGAALALLVASIYGGKCALAVQLRRANRRARQLESQVADLQARLDRRERPSRHEPRGTETETEPETTPQA